VVVVTVMMVIVVVVMMVIAMMMMRRNRRCISVARADDGHRDDKGNSQPEGRQERLLHVRQVPFARAAF
jgi:hypothetical protein